MRLAAYLAERGITHGDFAKEIGVSQAAITRYANGERLPRPEHLRAIVARTGGEVTINDFYAPVPPPEPERVAS